MTARRKHRENDRIGDDRAISRFHPIRSRCDAGISGRPNARRTTPLRSFQVVCPVRSRMTLRRMLVRVIGKRRRQSYIRIVFLLRKPMVPGDVIGPVRVHVAEQRIVSQPRPREIVQPHVVEEQAVRGVMRDMPKLSCCAPIIKVVTIKVRAFGHHTNSAIAPKITADA